MRVLLDECVNPRVREAFPNHEIQTVQSMGWAGITNGKLIALAQQSFDVFVTVDQNLEHQQNLPKLKLGLIVVTVPDNNIKYFRPIFSACSQPPSPSGPAESFTLPVQKCRVEQASCQVRKSGKPRRIRRGKRSTAAPTI